MIKKYRAYSGTFCFFRNINYLHSIICILFIIDCIYESYCLIKLFRSDEYKIRKI